jgi:uncharacterized membrane protein YkvA (DUF1232 family)
MRGFRGPVLPSPSPVPAADRGNHVRSRVARASRKRREDPKASTEGRRKQRIGLRRVLTLAAFLPLASRAPTYGRLFWELVRDDRTPVGRKALLAAALGYVALGRDLVPDDLPVIGGLDDLVVVVLAVDVFLDGVPADVLDEKLDELGIDARAFREDVSRIRRFTPGVLRRIMRRAPGMLALAGDTLHNGRLGPRVRTWINKEGSLA